MLDARFADEYLRGEKGELLLFLIREWLGQSRVYSRCSEMHLK